MAISVGTKAPNFVLKSKTPTGLVDVKLSDNLGKKNTVLLFFPAAFTGVCTSELCDTTAGLAQYDSLNANVIAISVDTPFAQEAWAQKEKIGVTLASDLNKTTIAAYDVVFPMLAGVGDTAARAAFVIDKQGVVQYSERTATPKDLPNFKAVKDTLAKLKYAAADVGKLTAPVAQRRLERRQRRRADVVFNPLRVHLRDVIRDAQRTQKRRHRLVPPLAFGRQRPSFVCKKNCPIRLRGDKSHLAQPRDGADHRDMRDPQPSGQVHHARFAGVGDEVGDGFDIIFGNFIGMLAAGLGKVFRLISRPGSAPCIAG